MRPPASDGKQVPCDPLRAETTDHDRLETLRLAGKLQVPFTTGILIGIGETDTE